jgi:hypothetical protein
MDFFLYPMTQQQPQRPIFLRGTPLRRAAVRQGRLSRLHLPHSPPCAPRPPPLLSCFRSSLSLRLPFLPLSVPVDSAAAVVPGALRWGRRRTWGCGAVGSISPPSLLLLFSYATRIVLAP